MKGFPKIVVALNIKKMNALTLCVNAKGVKTANDPDVVNPPVSDTTLQQQADNVLALLKLRVTVRKKSLTAQTAVAMDILKVSYEKVGRYVEMIARHKAMETGSVEAGENVVARCGFTLKKKRQMASRTFTIVSSGSGYTHLRAKAAAKNAVYVWRFGRTSEKGVRPLEFMPIAVTSRSLLTHFFQFLVSEIWIKKQRKNQAQKFLFEFFHHFHQIPGSCSHKSIDLYTFFP